jgi:hypothetical protein
MLNAVAFSFDAHGLGMTEQAVEQRGGERGIVHMGPRRLALQVAYPVTTVLDLSDQGGCFGHDDEKETTTAGCGKDRFGQGVLFEKSAIIYYPWGIRCTSATQIHTDKATHCLTVLNRTLYPFTGKPKTQLDHVQSSIPPTSIGERPLFRFGYYGSIDVISPDHGVTASILAKNRRGVFVVSCLAYSS